MKLKIVNQVSLDGVAQAPARPDEDRSGGFEHGGWTAPYQDAVLAETMGKGMAKSQAEGGALLLGRKTYQDFFNVWPQRKESPIAAHLERVRKFVVSRTVTEPLPWNNSVLLRGDAVESVRKLRSQPGPDLTILGSLDLCHALIRAQLVDEYLLTVFPLLLGSGRRLFPEGVHLSLEMSDATTTPKGVIIATYRPPRGDKP